MPVLELHDQLLKLIWVSNILQIDTFMLKALHVKGLNNNKTRDCGNKTAVSKEMTHLKKYCKTFLFIFKRSRIEYLSLKLSEAFIFKTLDPEWYKVHSRPRMVQSSPTESQNDSHQNIICLISYRIVYHDNRFRKKIKRRRNSTHKIQKSFLQPLRIITPNSH